MTINKKHLQLHKETIRNLSSDELDAVLGGKANSAPQTSPGRPSGGSCVGLTCQPGTLKTRVGTCL